MPELSWFTSRVQQGFCTGSHSLRGQFCSPGKSGNVWRHFSLSHWRWVGAICVCRIDAGVATKCPVKHRTALHNREHPVQKSAVRRWRDPAVTEGIQRLREIGMLKWFMLLTHPLNISISFTRAVRNLWRESLASSERVPWWLSSVSQKWQWELLGSLNSEEMMGSWVAGVKWHCLIDKHEESMITVMGSKD